MKARQSYVVVKYNDKDITKIITDYIESFQYVDNASGKADTISIKLNNKNEKWSSNWIPMQGDNIQAIIRLTNWNSDGDNRKYNCGFFIIDDLEFSGPPSIASIGGIATPLKEDFNVTEKSKTWEKTTVKNILEKIAEEAGVGLYFSGENYPIDELEQSAKTNQAFAFELCKSYNLAMKLYNRKIVVFDQTEYEKKKSTMTIKKSQVESWSIKKKMTYAYDGVIINYTDSKKNETLSYKFMITEGKRILKINESAESLQDAEIKAKAKLLENNRNCQTVSVKLKGDTKFISSNCCNLSGFGKLDGKYYIDTVTHEKNPDGGYYCTLEMHLCVIVKGVTVAKVDSGNTMETTSDSSTTGKIYTIVSGDTLWKISTQFLGSGDKYMQIYNANSETIEAVARQNGKSSSNNGHWIYPGTTLNIP